MNSSTRGYQAYLLRLWQSDTDEGPVWRASMESPQTSERQAFASLEQLFAFLEEETSRHPTRAQSADGEENAQETWILSALDRKSG